MPSPLSAADLLHHVGDLWIGTKNALEYLTGFNKDSLHVPAGVVLQITFAAILRTSVCSIWPWIMVLALELGNEIIDLSVDVWADPAAQRREAVEDLIVTMMPATLLMLVARWRPQLLCK